MVYKAFTFDPREFHRGLDAKTIFNGEFHPSSLCQIVKTIVSQASPSTQEILYALRYDDEWLDNSDPETSRLSNWYMIALAQTLTPTHGLVHYQVLERILPKAGWPVGEVTMLVSGNSLTSLVKSYGTPTLIAQFKGLDQFGAWLDLGEVTKFHSQLVMMNNDFKSPSDDLLAQVSGLSTLVGKAPSQLISQAYSEVLTMLESALSRTNALFYIFH